MNARARRGRVGGWWSFSGVGCSLLVVVLKEETKGKKLDSGISFPSILVSLLSSVRG